MVSGEKGSGVSKARAFSERDVSEKTRSSEKEFMVDASELSGEEGRGKLRKATGRSTHPVIRR